MMVPVCPEHQAENEQKHDAVIGITTDVNNSVDPKLRYKCFTFSEVLQPFLILS